MDTHTYIISASMGYDSSHSTCDTVAFQPGIDLLVNRERGSYGLNQER